MFQWSCFRDYAKGYLKDMGLVALGIFSTLSAISYLFTAVIFRYDLPLKHWGSILGGILIGSILLAQGYIHYRVARRLIPGERLEAQLTKIAELREEGVTKLQNIEQSQIKTAEDYKKFHSQFVEWRDRLILEIAKVSPSQASIFRVLGTVQFKASIEGYQGDAKKELEKLLGIITDYTERIKKMVDRFSLENLSNRVK